ncbi:hypothetical protein NOVOSPHI9U_10286 [Novosphingobium sp. 9U]|nr:hypothetical protein NOVOSPHI9U_10286 [Novosphingobium sp. 9U]
MHYHSMATSLSCSSGWCNGHSLNLRLENLSARNCTTISILTHNAVQRHLGISALKPLVHLCRAPPLELYDHVHVLADAFTFYPCDRRAACRSLSWTSADGRSDAKKAVMLISRATGNP